MLGSKPQTAGPTQQWGAMKEVIANQSAPSDDEFYGGIWWVPDGNGQVRNATPGECATEIKRLQDENEQMLNMLRRAMEHGLNGNLYYHALRAGDLGDKVRAFLLSKQGTASGM